MERLPRGVYTNEFREEPEEARRLSLPGGTLKNWVYASRHSKRGEVGRNQNPLAGLEMGLARVKRELAEVRMERDLLNSPWPTLRRSRGEVHSNGIMATAIPGSSDMPSF